jgi:hypothetical protein
MIVMPTLSSQRWSPPRPRPWLRCSGSIPGWRGRPAPLSQCFFIHFTASHGKAQHIVDQITTGQAIAIVSTFDDLARIPGGVASLVRRWESPVVQASRSGRPTMK